jgi:hypothetical protein
MTSNFFPFNPFAYGTTPFGATFNQPFNTLNNTPFNTPVNYNYPTAFGGQYTNQFSNPFNTPTNYTNGFSTPFNGQWNTWQQPFNAFPGATPWWNNSGFSPLNVNGSYTGFNPQNQWFNGFQNNAASNFTNGWNINGWNPLTSNVNGWNNVSAFNTPFVGASNWNTPFAQTPWYAQNFIGQGTTPFAATQPFGAVQPYNFAFPFGGSNVWNGQFPFGYQNTTPVTGGYPTTTTTNGQTNGQQVEYTGRVAAYPFPFSGFAPFMCVNPQQTPATNCTPATVAA